MTSCLENHRLSEILCLSELLLLYSLSKHYFLRPEFPPGTHRHHRFQPLLQFLQSYNLLCGFLHHLPECNFPHLCTDAPDGKYLFLNTSGCLADQHYAQLHESYFPLRTLGNHSSPHRNWCIHTDEMPLSSHLCKLPHSCKHSRIPAPVFYLHIPSALKTSLYTRNHRQYTSQCSPHRYSPLCEVHCAWHHGEASLHKRSLLWSDIYTSSPC